MSLSFKKDIALGIRGIRCAALRDARTRRLGRIGESGDQRSQPDDLWDDANRPYARR